MKRSRTELYELSPQEESAFKRAHLEGREAEIQLLAQHFANNGFRDEPPKPKPALGSRERLEAIRKYLVSEMPAYREAKKLGGVAVRQDRLLTALTLRMEFPGLGPKGVMTAKELQDVFDYLREYYKDEKAGKEDVDNDDDVDVQGGGEAGGSARPAH